MKGKTVLTGFYLVLFLFLSTIGWSQPLSPVSPKNGLVINNDSILLKWNKLPNAIFYELKYTTDSTFTTGVVTVNMGLQTSLWLTPLSSNTTYYWRVEGNTGSNTVIGQSRKFTNFKPTDIAGCSLWLRADTGITLNGNNVQGWADASINNFNVVQPLASSQPTYISNSINGYPSLSFDGGDIYNITNFPFSNYVNCFVVAKKTNAAVNHGNIISAGTFDLEMQTLKCVIVSSANGVVGSYDAVNWSQIVLQRQSGNSKAFFNGLQSGTTNTIGLNPIPQGNFTIGNRNPAVNSPTPFRGNISEIVVCSNEFNDSLSYIMQNYLMDKYTKELSAGDDTIVSDNFCPISLSATLGFQSYLWSNGDTSATTTVFESGVYFVQAVDLFNRIQIDTIVVNYPIVNQLSNPILCYGSQLIWNTNLSNTYSFVWSDNSNASSLTIVQPGIYYVNITDQLGCIYHSDSLNVILDNFPVEAFIGNDTSLCSGNTIQLQNGASVASNYLWSNGSINDSLLITNGGSFWLEVSNINNCIARDTINITLTGIAPLADYNHSNVCLGLGMPFIDLSMPASGDTIVGWEWNFNDNTTSSIQNPIHTYADAGIYQVTLKAISQTGCAGLINKLVTVYPHPNLNFVSFNACNNKETTLSDITDAFGGTILNWQWNFNDSLSSSNSGLGETVMHTFTAPGNYNVQLSVTTLEGCNDSITKTIEIKKSPIAAFSHSKLCLGDSVHFQDVSIITFPHQNIFREWTFNDTLVYNEYQPSIWYNSAGNFNVNLVIMASNGCKDTVNENIFVSNLPNSDFTYNSPCIGDSTGFNDISSCTNCTIEFWKWTVNGVIISNEDSTEFVFNNAGVYSINLEATTNEGCSSNIVKNIVINNKPIADFIPSESIGSPPMLVSFVNNSFNGLNYYWDFGDGNLSEEFAPVHLFQDTGLYNVKLTAIDSNGCAGIDNQIIKVLPKKLDMAIIDAKLQLDKDYIYTDLTFLNYSTVTITEFDISIKSNGNPNNLIEKWEGILLPGEIKKYRLNSAFFNDTYDKIDYLCFDITEIKQGIDDKLNNNIWCSIINEDFFKIASIYPNPVKDKIYLVLLSPYANDISVQVINYAGEIIIEKKLKVEQGYNEVPVETLNLLNGPYLIKVNFEGFTYVEKIIKLGDN